MSMALKNLTALMMLLVMS